MENNNGDWEQKPLSLIINELVQGKELVKQLRSHLDKSSSSTTGEYLIEMALGSFDKALSMINQIGSSSSDNNNNNNNNNIPQSVGGTNITSPNSTGSTGSPRSDDSGHGGDMYKKRKTVPQWSKQVKVSSDTGFEGPLEDGYSWRKYGQKAINGATYPRGYYRCTYLHSQGCLARKQVQRSTNPSIFNVTYRGKHTCIQTSHLINQASQSPSKHTFQNQEHPYHNQEQKSSKEVVILNFGTGLSIKTEDLDTQELTINPPPSTFSFPSTSKAEGYMKTVPTTTSTDQNTLSPLRKHERSPVVGNYSPTFLSPTSSDQSNYFSEWQQVENKSDQLNEVVSAATSGSNSPILDMPDLTLDNDPFDFESNFFPFDIRDFLS